MADNGNGNGKVLSFLVKTLIPLLSLLAGAALAWGAMGSRVAELCRAVDDHEARLRMIEERITRIDERTARMERDIGDIKEGLK